MESLSRLNASIFVYVLERVPAAPDGYTWKFEGPEGGRAQAVGASRLQVDPTASVVFTLGALGRRVIVTLTDTDPARMAPLLARVEREAPADPASVAFPLDDPWVKEHGRAGVALLPPSTTRFFPRLPDAILFDEGALLVSAAVFLDAEELALAREHGVTTLAERFRVAGRNIVRFAHRARA
ncbi:MAG TPA: hypothetical protein VFL83_11305 [Anaeromyxobacter sp.]|nr:hypothetical protein [Anaeromyxobacter sp.]